MIRVHYGVNVELKSSTALNKQFNLTCAYLNIQVVLNLKTHFTEDRGSLAIHQSKARLAERVSRDFM